MKQLLYLIVLFIGMTYAKFTSSNGVCTICNQCSCPLSPTDRNDIAEAVSDLKDKEKKKKQLQILHDLCIQHKEKWKNMVEEYQKQ